MGVPGIYGEGDPHAKTDEAKRGRLRLDLGKAWIKSPSLTAGQAPVMHYNRQLMQAILWGRMEYLNEVLNPAVIRMEQAVEAYQLFDKGEPKKYIIDPHGTLGKAA